MKLAIWLPVVLMVVANAGAAEPTGMRPPPPPEPRRSQFVFSLLPKSFQRHPSLDFHVITEMTAEGRKVAEPTPARPVYYLTQAGKFTQLGNNTPANEHPPSVEDLQRAMESALAGSSYLPAKPTTPLPGIVVVFNYGSFARFSTDAHDFQTMVAMQQMNEQALDADPNAQVSEPFMPAGDDRDVDALLPIVLANRTERLDVLQRAGLVGGEKFARNLARVLEEEAVYNQSGSSLIPGISSSSPFHRFMNSSDEAMTLVEETFSSCYFVVASAYDYVAMKQGKRVLLWRTKMTVNSAGVSMSESLPSLVLTAGPYFGRDMTDSVTLTRRISREGRVEVGTPTVVDYSEAPPEQPSKPAGNAPQQDEAAPGGAGKR